MLVDLDLRGTNIFQFREGAVLPFRWLFEQKFYNELSRELKRKYNLLGDAAAENARRELDDESIISCSSFNEERRRVDVMKCPLCSNSFEMAVFKIHFQNCME